jgi:hypothetical protein
VKAIKSQREEIERLRGMVDGQQEKEMGEGIISLSQDQRKNQEKLVVMLNELAVPWEAVVTQLADVKGDLGEIHAGTYHSFTIPRHIYGCSLCLGY